VRLRYILYLPNGEGVTDTDDEWLALIMEAKAIGLTVEEIREWMEGAHDQAEDSTADKA
jgi:DNA-binding transcriptional MerR regulator